MTFNKNSDGSFQPWGHGNLITAQISSTQKKYYMVKWRDDVYYPGILKTSSFRDLPEACAWSIMLQYNNQVFVSLEEISK